MRVTPYDEGRPDPVTLAGTVVYEQAIRMRSEARLHTSLAQAQVNDPKTRFLVIEPKQTDATLFMYSPMNFAARRAILEEGYTG